MESIEAICVVVDEAPRSAINGTRHKESPPGRKLYDARILVSTNRDRVGQGQWINTKANDHFVESTSNLPTSGTTADRMESIEAICVVVDESPRSAINGTRHKESPPGRKLHDARILVSTNRGQFS
ncbi:unnamed protein product [Anisakis simplex]|uniref:DUF5641 domain-containing protein n=1 Tax=Anisakis simplex TaxID=6269 RepID=A0A0M3KKD1_ANISI|nr:unnamed protein product [Anisakis simplex]